MPAMPDHPSRRVLITLTAAAIFAVAAVLAFAVTRTIPLRRIVVTKAGAVRLTEAGYGVHACAYGRFCARPRRMNPRWTTTYDLSFGNGKPAVTLAGNQVRQVFYRG